MAISLDLSKLILWIYCFRKVMKLIEFYHLKDLSGLFLHLCPLLNEFFYCYFKGNRLFRHLHHFEWNGLAAYENLIKSSNFQMFQSKSPSGRWMTPNCVSESKLVVWMDLTGVERTDMRHLETEEGRLFHQQHKGAVVLAGVSGGTFLLGLDILC